MSVHTHKHTQQFKVCSILGKSTGEDRMLDVWTSVSWAPERPEEGKCFLSSLIPPFSFSSSHLSLLFHPSLKLERGLEGLSGMLQHRSLIANNHRLEQ